MKSSVFLGIWMFCSVSYKAVLFSKSLSSKQIVEIPEIHYNVKHLHCAKQ